MSPCHADFSQDLDPDTVVHCNVLCSSHSMHWLFPVLVLFNKEELCKIFTANNTCIE